MRVIDENTALWILIVSVAIFMILIGFEHTREEKTAAREGEVSEKHIERIKGKVRFFSAVTGDGFQFFANYLVFFCCGVPLLLGIPLIWLALFSGGWDAGTRIMILAPVAGIVALLLLWSKIKYFCVWQLLRLNNKLWFFESLYAAQRDGCDLNAMRPLLERELQRRNDAVPEQARREMAHQWDGAPWRGTHFSHAPEVVAAWRTSDAGRVATETEQDALMRTAEEVAASEAAIEQLERYEGELKELAQEELETRREVIRLAKEGDVKMAHLLAGAASFKKFQRETLENRDRRIKAKQEQLAAQQAAAQTEPKQVEEDSIRALLGARIKEMEVILGRLQAERERLANVASAEELDALEMEIRARQKLIHAINQGADDMELHLCVQRVQLHEENRKEFEQMRLSDA